MRVLVCFENRVRPDSTGVYIINAFRKLGHSVDHVTPDALNSVSKQYDFYVKVDDGIYSPWNKNLHPSYYYCIDTHIETDWRLKIAKEGEFDLVSVTHSQGLSLPWDREVFWNPVGCDPDIHFIGLKDKKTDGVFIGNFHNNLAGRRVDMLDVFSKECQSFFFGNRTFREMTDKYAESKLVFNCSINGDANMRVFEALCSGSCLITDRIPDLDKLGLIDKSHYFGYSTAEELKDLTQMLLREHSLRERTAKNGRFEAVNKHAYSHRIQEALNRLSNLKEKEIVCPQR